MSLPHGYTVRVLNGLEAAFFLNMTFRSYQPLLVEEQPGQLALAIGAFHHETPVGLAVSVLDAATRAAELLSLFCEPSHRRRGLGAKLLAATEQELNARNAHQVSAT